MTKGTAQEREDNAEARAQNEVLQAAVNALQFQMASVGQGGPAINAIQTQQPHQAQMQAQQMTERHQNSNISRPPLPPPESMTVTTSGTNTAMAGTAAKPPAMVTIPTAGRLSAAKQPTFSAKGTQQGTRQHSRPQCNGELSNMRLPSRGPEHATPTTSATTSGRISTAPTSAIRKPAPSPHQLLILLVPWVCGQCAA